MPMAAFSRDFYEVLGVGRDVSDEELKRAYRKMALKYHPDRNPGDKDAEERFKECSAAYQVLSDPDRRAQYDRFGSAAFDGGAAGFDCSAGFEDIFSGIFSDFFGQPRSGRAQSRARRGPAFQPRAYVRRRGLRDREDDHASANGDVRDVSRQRREARDVAAQVS